MAAGRWRESDHGPHRGRLAGAVGVEEAGHQTGSTLNDTLSTAVKALIAPREFYDFDHGPSLAHLTGRRHPAKVADLRRPKSSNCVLPLVSGQAFRSLG